MNKIMEAYKIDEMTQLARNKIEKQYLEGELPKTNGELEKAIR